MPASKESESPKRPRGRPVTRIVKLDATPEQAARNFFSAVKVPDPKLRIAKRKRSEGSTA